MLTDAKRAERKTGIGGSDIAAVLGLSRFKTPMDVFLEKTRDDYQNTGNEQAKYWGSILEDVVAAEYQRRTESKVQRVKETLRHPEYDWIICNIDRAVIVPEIAGNVRWKNNRLTTNRIVECKTANAWTTDEWGLEGTDQIPADYILQTQWQMGITKAETTDVPVLIGGQEYRIFTVALDEALFYDMAETALPFWKRTQEGIAPDPQSVADAMKLWPQHIASKSVIVGIDVAKAVTDLRELGILRREIETQESQLKTVVAKAFEDAEEITHGGIRLATFRTNTNGTRVLRLSNTKGE